MVLSFFEQHEFENRLGVMAIKKSKVTSKKTVEKKTSSSELIDGIYEMIATQREIAKSLERLEKKMDNSNHAQSAFFKDISGNLGKIIKNQSVFYTKFLLTRLNLVELSEGKRVSVSKNEQMEFENSKLANPDQRIASLPQLTEARTVIDKKWAH